MPNTDPEVIRFCNQKIRPIADRFSQLYYEAKSIQQEWIATNMGVKIPYNSSEIIIDGSETDGRHQIDGIKVNNMINRLIELITELESDTSSKLNTILAIAVNSGG